MVINIISAVFLIAFLTTIISIARGGPFVSSDKATVKNIVKLAKVKKGEKAVDLGSGDGRIVIALAKTGGVARGYEINPFLVLWSRICIKRQGLSKIAKVYWRSFWGVDLSGFSVVTVYGISYIMQDLEKKLKKELKPGARVISFAFEFPTWKPVKKKSNVFLYKV